LFFGHLIKVEESFHLCQNMLGTLKKLWCSKNFERLENFYSVEYFWAIYVGWKICCCCPPFCVLSHMKESMLARTTLEALVNMRRYFNLLKLSGQTNLLLHPNLIPNLETTKIFIRGIKISQHILPPLNPNAISMFAKSVSSFFYPFCVNGRSLGLVYYLSSSH
jgi:hypothetical protein